MTPENAQGKLSTESVQIRSINSAGHGVGNLKDGRVVFIPRTVPGDTVSVTVTESKPRWCKGKLIEVVKSSSDRVDPVCPHYSSCNGCALQHMAYEAQLEWKINTVEECFKRIGGIDISVSGIQPSPEQYSYRSRLSFSLLRLRNSRVIAGFHTLGAPQRIENIDKTCALGETPLIDAWKSLRKGWGDSARLLPSGRKLKLTLRNVSQGVALVIHGGKRNGDPDALMRRVPEIVSVWNVDDRGNEILLGGEQLLYDQRLGEQVEVGPTSFLQANRSCEIHLNDWIVEQINPCEGMRVIDAYCGLGIYGRRIAKHGANVIGIERNLTDDFHQNSREPGNLECLAGTVEKLLPEVMPADALILNPPRVGLSRSVATIVNESGPWLVLYVSCDPATLARDIDRMKESYRVGKIRLFDLFPQTSHTETVAVMHRKA